MLLKVLTTVLSPHNDLHSPLTSLPSCVQHKPVSKLFSKAYDLGCKLWFRQDGVHLLDDAVFDELEAANVLPCCTERFRGQVPLIPALQPWHGIWVGRRASQAELEEVDELDGFEEDN